MGSQGFGFIQRKSVDSLPGCECAFENASSDADSGVFATTLPVPNQCLADLNGDNVVDTADLGILIGQFGSQCPCTADLNGDGVVDTADMGIMIGVFGMNCQGCTVAMAQGTPLSLMVRTGVTLMSELGFTDPGAYREWFNALSEAERQAHLEDAIEIIQLAP